MSAIENIVQHKRSARGERIMRKRGPLLVENTKNALILKGHHTSQLVNDTLKDIAKLISPHCKVLNRKNEILPFEDINSLEFLAEKNDCSMFLLGSHTKKRPNNLVLGRLYDGHLLDMIELGIENVQSICDFNARTKSIGSKPLFVFLGDQWGMDSTYTRVQNLIIDFFRGNKLEMISLKGIDHVIGCSVVEGKIHLRLYTVMFKKSGTKVPTVHLSAMGPFLDLSLRRTNLASQDLFKTACKIPKIVTETKVKNVKRTEMGDKIGRIHMKKQNLDTMQVKRIKVLRDTGGKKESEGADQDGADSSSGRKRNSSEKGSKKRKAEDL